MPVTHTTPDHTDVTDYRRRTLHILIAAHAIFFSQTHDILRDELTVNIVRSHPQGEVVPR